MIRRSYNRRCSTIISITGLIFILNLLRSWHSTLFFTSLWTCLGTVRAKVLLGTHHHPYTPGTRPRVIPCLHASLVIGNIARVWQRSGLGRNNESGSGGQGKEARGYSP